MANDIEFIIFYTAFILFVVYMGGISGYSIIQAGDFDICSETITQDCINLEFSLNPVTAFSTFAILLSINSTYQVLFTLIFVPYAIALIWIFFKWLRGTG